MLSSRPRNSIYFDKSSKSRRFGSIDFFESDNFRRPTSFLSILLISSSPVMMARKNNRKDQKGGKLLRKNKKRSIYISLSAWSCFDGKDKAREVVCVEWPKFPLSRVSKSLWAAEKGWGGRWRVSIFFLCSCLFLSYREIYFILRQRERKGSLDEPSPTSLLGRKSNITRCPFGSSFPITPPPSLDCLWTVGVSLLCLVPFRRQTVSLRPCWYFTPPNHPLVNHPSHFNFLF